MSMAALLPLLLLGQLVGALPHHRSDASYDVYRSVSQSDRVRRLVEDAVKTFDGECRLLDTHEAEFVCRQGAGEELLARLSSQGVELVRVELAQTEDRSSGLSWEKYHRFNVIEDWLKETAEKYPDFVQLSSVGSTYENRSLYLLKIGRHMDDKDRPSVWVDGGIHAREWISVSTALYIVHQLVQAFNTSQAMLDSKLQAVTSVNWYVMPLLNPDGYEYTHTGDRQWRKNRAPNDGSDCVGVDLNRNWGGKGYGKGPGTTSSNPCSDVYMGPSIFSEKESWLTSQTISQYNETIRIYMTLHSFGQKWLSSWGYTDEVPSDDEELRALGQKAVDAISAVNPDRHYDVERAGEFYIAGGASDDWAKEVANIKYSYTVELPGTGEDENSKFVLDAGEITKVGEEIWATVQMMAVEVTDSDTWC